MKPRINIILLLALFAWAGASAQSDGKAAEYMRKLVSSMESMGSYTVCFTAKAGDENISGRYAVDADRYYISVAGNEVYGDDSIRCEVDASKREIVVDSADMSSPNILTNPTRGFRFLETDYTPRLESESAGSAAITLVPKNKGAAGTITITCSTADIRPRQIVYNTEGESVTIVVESIAKGADVPDFDAVNYPDYEIIDFR